MNFFKYTGILAFFILTACTHHQLVPEPINRSTLVTKRSVDTLTNWEINGAIAAKHHKRGWASSLSWHQQGLNYYQIRLFGPLGGGAVVIEKQAGRITYQDGPKVISSTNADQLLQEQTGIRLPVNHLYYWVRGLPAPSEIQTSTRNSNNQLILLKQAGYTIMYANYIEVEHMILPTKITIEGHDIRVKLLIKRWQL